VHPSLFCDHKSIMLQKYNTFYGVIEDISVIKCNKYNNLHRKDFYKIE